MKPETKRLLADLREIRNRGKFDLAVIRWCHGTITTAQLTEARVKFLGKSA